MEIDWTEFALGGFKLMCGIVLVNSIAGGVTFLIANNRGSNVKMMVFLVVIFMMGGIVYGTKNG